MLPYTANQLEQTFDRDLYFIVDKICMGNNPHRQLHIPGYYTNSWEDFGDLVEEMLGRGFKPDVQTMAGPLVSFGWIRIGVPREGHNRWSYTGPFWPRTAAIAAVMACEANPKLPPMTDSGQKGTQP